MKLSTWLNAERGRVAAMARHFEVTLAAVSQWQTNGVPRDRMIGVRAYTAGAVTLEDMLAETSDVGEATGGVR